MTDSLIRTLARRPAGALARPSMVALYTPALSALGALWLWWVARGDGAVADAAATALVLAGVGDWQRIAAQMGVQLAMLVDERGTVHMPPAMAERVHFTGEPPPVQLTAGR